MKLAVGWAAREVVSATLVVLGVGLGLWLLVQLSPVIVAGLIALVVGSGITPLVRVLERRGLARPVAALIVYSVILCAIAGAMAIVLPRLIDNVSVFAQRLPSYYAGIRSLLASSRSQVLRGVSAAMPEQLAIHLGGARGSALSGALSLANVVGQGMFITAAVFVLVFYWLVYGDSAVAATRRLIPRRQRARVAPVIDEALSKLGAFVRGEIVISVLIGMMSYLAYALIGLPEAEILGLLAGALEALPIIGPLFALVAACLIALATHPALVFWVLGAAIAIQLSESYLLWPRIMGRAVGVDPAICLVAVAIIGSVWGVPGAFLAVPLTVVGQIVIEHVRAHRPPPESAAEVAEIARAHDDVLRLAYDAARAQRSNDPALHEVGRELRALVFDLDRVLEQSETRAGSP
jgi:predicted PurR-regulated permease PerM